MSRKYLSRVRNYRKDDEETTDGPELQPPEFELNSNLDATVFQFMNQNSYQPPNSKKQNSEENSDLIPGLKNVAGQLAPPVFQMKSVSSHTNFTIQRDANMSMANNGMNIFSPQSSTMSYPKGSTIGDNQCFTDVASKNAYEGAKLKEATKELDELLFRSFRKKPYEIMAVLGVHHDNIKEIDAEIFKLRSKSIDTRLHELFPGEKNEEYLLTDTYLRNGKMSYAASIELACIGAGKMESEVLRICKAIGGGSARKEVDDELKNHYGKKSPRTLPNGDLSTIAQIIYNQNFGYSSTGVECMAYLANGRLLPADEFEISMAKNDDVRAISILYKYGYETVKNQYEGTYGKNMDYPVNFETLKTRGRWRQEFMKLSLGQMSAEDILIYNVGPYGKREDFWMIVSHISNEKGTQYQEVIRQLDNPASELNRVQNNYLNPEERNRFNTFFGNYGFESTMESSDYGLTMLKKKGGYGKDQIINVILQAGPDEWLQYYMAYKNSKEFQAHLKTYKLLNETFKVIDGNTIELLFNPDITERIILAAKLGKEKEAIGLIENFGLTKTQRASLLNNTRMKEYTQGSTKEQKASHSSNRDRWASENSRKLNDDFKAKDKANMELRNKDYGGFSKSNQSRILIALNSDSEGVKASRKGVDSERSGLGSAIWELGSDSGKLLEAYQIDTEVALKRANKDGYIDEDEHKSIEKANTNTQEFMEYYKANRDKFSDFLQTILEIAISVALAPFTGGASLLEGMAFRQFGKMVITKTFTDLISKQLADSIVNGERAKNYFTVNGFANSAISSVSGSILRDVKGLAPNIAKNFIEGIPPDIASHMMQGKSFTESLALFAQNIPQSLIQNSVQTTIFAYGPIKNSIDKYNQFVKSKISVISTEFDSKNPFSSINQSQQPMLMLANIPRKPSDYEYSKMPDRYVLIKDFLYAHGSWKKAINDLAGSPHALDQAFIQDMVNYRKQIFEGIIGDKAKLRDEASNNPESDMDWNFTGNNAGRNLMDMEAKMVKEHGPNWEKVFRANFYTDSSRLTNGAMHEDKAGGKEFAAQVTKDAEVYNLARMLQSAKGNEASLKATREQIAKLAPDQAARIESYAKMTDSDIAESKKFLLNTIDQLTTRRNTLPAGSDELIHLDRRITWLQQELNFYTYEADVSPGAFVKSSNPDAHYQIVLNNLSNISHISAEYGNLGAAAREYEVFKYMHRIFQSLDTLKIPVEGDLVLWKAVAEEIGSKVDNSSGNKGGDRSIHMDAGYIRKLSDAQIAQVTANFSKIIFDGLAKFKADKAAADKTSPSDKNTAINASMPGTPSTNGSQSDTTKGNEVYIPSWVHSSQRNHLLEGIAQYGSLDEAYKAFRKSGGLMEKILADTIDEMRANFKDMKLKDDKYYKEGGSKFQLFKDYNAAKERYFKMIDDAPEFEVGIFVNKKTNEYIVIKGLRGEVENPNNLEDILTKEFGEARAEGYWILEDHYHPVGEDGNFMKTAVIPSGEKADFEILVDESIRWGFIKRTSHIHMKTPDGITSISFSFDPSSKKPFQIEHTDPVTKEYIKIEYPDYTHFVSGVNKKFGNIALPQSQKFKDKIKMATDAVGE